MKVVYTGDMDPRTAKDVFAKVIPEICESDAQAIYLDADLMSCIGTAKWAKNHLNEKAINCGIAEANMIGIAAGLASEGFKPIVHSFGPFASRRCFDQVFLSGAYAHNDMTIIGSDPGVTATYNGGTHMPFEDVAMYRTIPTATVIEPSDPGVLEWALKKCQEIPGIKYIRVGRKQIATVYDSTEELEIGKANVLREGEDVTIIAAGIMIREAMEAARALDAEGIHAAVIDCFSIKPIDADCIEKYARRTGKVVVAENASCHGGLYSAVLEVLAQRYPVPALSVSVEDEFGEVGTQSYLQGRFRLTSAHIIEQVKKLF